jgi:L-asparaginase
LALNYDLFDGFVILHGTDTMAYSASALSFMLRNLEKPVIFTGSQLPIGLLRTDGKENLITAIEIAAAEADGQPLVPEVCVYFENKLMRGTGQPS